MQNSGPREIVLAPEQDPPGASFAGAGRAVAGPVRRSLSEVLTRAKLPGSMEVMHDQRRVSAAAFGARASQTHAGPFRTSL